MKVVYGDLRKVRPTLEKGVLKGPLRIRDVNGVGRVQVVAPLYHIRAGIHYAGTHILFYIHTTNIREYL